MQLKTSSCKWAAFRKDISRFSPVWLGYILVMGLVLILMLGDGDLSYWYHSNLASSIMVMAVLNCGYALVTAQMLFGDLFNTRLCYGLHALPLKREHWYSAHIKAGMFFSLIPTALMTLVCLGISRLADGMTDSWQIPLYWFAAVNLQYLFFFGLAVFCAMCTGSRFAMAAVYGVINLGAVLVMLLVDSLYVPMLYGVLTPETLFLKLCPLVYMAGARNAQLIDTERIYTGKTYLDEFGVIQKERIGIFTLNPAGWQYLAIVAVLGILLLLIARRLYRKRRLECAGDFAATAALEPVFLVIIALTGAAGLNGFVYLFFGSNLAVWVTALGLVCGWYAGLMFIKRSTRVLTGKSILGVLVLGALLAGSLYVTRLDPFGIETFIPELDQIETATMRGSYNSQVENTREEAVLSDIRKVHELALQDRVPLNYMAGEGEREAISLSLVYTLKNGHEVKRNYNVYVDSPAVDIMAEHFGKFMNLAAFNSNLKDPKTPEDVMRAFREVNYLAVDGIVVPEEYNTPEMAEKLLLAVQADCDAGTMVQMRELHPEPVAELGDASYWNFSVELTNPDGEYFQFYVYADAANTMAVLEETGMPEQLIQERHTRFAG